MTKRAVCEGNSTRCVKEFPDFVNSASICQAALGCSGEEGLVFCTTWTSVCSCDIYRALMCYCEDALPVTVIEV